MNCKCGCATISRESDTVRALFTSARAAARRASVIRLTVPRWSSCPQRPQLFSRLKYDSTSACVGNLVAGMLPSSRGIQEYATEECHAFERRLCRRSPVAGGRHGGARRPARDDGRKGGKAPLRVLQLVAQRNQRQIEHVAHAVTSPVVVAHGLRVPQILAEHLGHARGESAVEEGEIQLVVERERAVVEVGAAD